MWYCRHAILSLYQLVLALPVTFTVRFLPHIHPPLYPAAAPPPLQSAQRLRDERDALEARLEQAGLERSMDAALAEAAKLRGVADELERDLTAQRLAEATARAGEAEALRERVAELEEENAGAGG